jgi:3-oxoacyl-[acyl-carrier protein] reductase
MQGAGAIVVVNGRNIAKMDEYFDDSFIKIPSDLSIDGAAEELIRKTIEKAGKIDVLVNNAGITKDGLIMRMTDEQFDDVINTNLRSTFKMCRAAVAVMARARCGRIINMASIIGVIGGPGQTNYAASKGGIIGMTKALAAEMGARGITANCIAPGFVKTPMTDVLSDELKANYLAQIPAKRFGEPEDIANACVFLASDEAGYINGQTLHVNGGLGRF